MSDDGSWTLITGSPDELTAIASICAENRRILSARTRSAGSAAPYHRAAGDVEDRPGGSGWAPDEQPGGDCDGPGDGADPTDPWGLAAVEHLRELPVCDDCPAGRLDAHGPTCPRAALCDLECAARERLLELDQQTAGDAGREAERAYSWRILGVEQPGGEPAAEAER